MKNPLWNRFPAWSLRSFLLISVGIHLSISIVSALVPDLRIKKLPSHQVEVTLLPLPVIAEKTPAPKPIFPRLKAEFKADETRPIEPVKKEESPAQNQTEPQQPVTHLEPVRKEQPLPQNETVPQHPVTHLEPVKEEEFPSPNESVPEEPEPHLSMEIPKHKPLPRHEEDEKPETDSVPPPVPVSASAPVPPPVPVLLPASSAPSSGEMIKPLAVKPASVALSSDPVFDSKVPEKTRFPDIGPPGDSKHVPDRSLPVEVDITITRPRYHANPKPAYPPEARKRGYQGEVMLRVEVLPSGCVGQVEVKKTSGYDLLDRSASSAVKQWKFIPATKGEEKIPFWVNIPVKFQLQ